MGNGLDFGDIDMEELEAMDEEEDSGDSAARPSKKARN